MDRWTGRQLDSVDGWVGEDWSEEVLSVLKMTQGTKVWIVLFWW